MKLLPRTTWCTHYTLTSSSALRPPPRQERALLEAPSHNLNNPIRVAERNVRDSPLHGHLEHRRLLRGRCSRTGVGGVSIAQAKGIQTKRCLHYHHSPDVLHCTSQRRESIQSKQPYTLVALKRSLCLSPKCIARTLLGRRNQLLYAKVQACI